MVGKQILSYKIVSLLGEGGMGSVYKAFDTQLERYVAIKIINPKLLKDPLSVERFRNEAINQAKLNHPNIVTVYGFIENREATGFVMEYVAGSTINQLIEDYGRLDLVYSLRVIQQVLLAIEYAHEIGFVHRDLKPSNIIIDQKGIVKIMDFGISKSINGNQNLTRVGFNIGTIHYMSPEQIKGMNPSAKTDIYSIGITLYEMLSGTPPFNYKSEYEIYEAHLKLAPPKLSLVFEDIPEAVDELILSALNKSPKRNFVNALEFRNSVEHLIFNLPLLLERPVNFQNQSKFVSNQKKGSSNFIIGFILILTLIIAVSAYLLVDKYIIKERVSALTDREAKIISSSPNNFFSESWENLSNKITSNISSISSFSSNLFVTGVNGEVYLSRTNGKNWEKLNQKIDFNISDSENLNGNLLIIGSSGNIILIDTNGNVIYSSKLVDENLFSINLNDKILICGSGGVILKSENKQFDFQKLNSPTSSALFDICQLNAETFLTCSWDGIIYKTSDGGKTFTANKLSKSYLKKIYFINEFLGFAGGSEGKLFRTTDGGDKWFDVKINTLATINDIIFVQQKIGYIVTSDGELFISENSGMDWFKVMTQNQSLNKITILNNGIIIIVGNNGTILKNKI